MNRIPDFPLPILTPTIRAIFIAIIIRDVIRKGISLRHASRREQKVWFICLLILNTLGILPIIYLIFFKKKSV